MNQDFDCDNTIFMTKGTTISDFGGYSHERGRRIRKRFKAENVRSFHCVQCNLLQFFTLREFSRAAIRHCFNCRGALEETAKSRERHVKRIDSLRLAKMDADTIESRVKGCRCKGCGSNWVDDNALMYHLSRELNCFSAHMDLTRLVIIDDQPFIATTIHMHDLGDEFAIEGITTACRLVTIQRAKNKRKAMSILSQFHNL